MLTVINWLQWTSFRHSEQSLLEDSDVHGLSRAFSPLTKLCVSTKFKNYRSDENHKFIKLNKQHFQKFNYLQPSQVCNQNNFTSHPPNLKPL